MVAPITTEYEIEDELQRRMLDLEESYSYSPPASPDPVATEAAITQKLSDDLVRIFIDVDRECVRIRLGLL